VKAVILSAGQGKRLLPLTEELPKCLLPVGGETTMLGWQLSQLALAGVDEAVVVTGFHADKVDRQLERPVPGLRARSLYNARYAVADNLTSVWMAREEMSEDFLLLNGDTLFHAGVVERLLAAPPAPIRVTISRKDSYDADDMKVHLDGERLVDVGKGLDPATVDAESIGMMLFRAEGVARFRDAVETAMQGEAAARSWYLSVIDWLAKRTPVDTAEAGPDEWCEVDFPVDVKRARAAVARWSAADSDDEAATGT